MIYYSTKVFNCIIMVESKFLFNFSQEHESLPVLEIESCLKSEKINYEIKEIKKSLCIISSSIDLCKRISKRLAYTYDCGLFLFKFRNKLEEIEKKIMDLEYNFSEILKNKSFKVIVKDLTSRNKYSESYEREIGKIIRIKSEKQGKVKLKNPEIVFMGYILGNEFYFCLKLESTSRNIINARPLKQRPYVHPSAINQILAHAMINLSQVNDNSIILDPFCGTGTIIIEAFFLKLRAIGIDINEKMIKGTLKNLKFFKTKKIDLIQGDVKSLMFSNECFDSIVCDPPYGRSSSTHKTPMKQLISVFFQNITKLLKKNGYICIALPHNLNALELLDKNQLIVEKKISYYVHKSLTRKIWVIKKR